MPFLIALAASVALQPSQPNALSEKNGSSLRSLTYVDFDLGAGYSTNPLLNEFDATGRAFGRVSARAVHERRSVRANTYFSAYLENSTYTGGYGSAQLASLNARHEFAPTEKLTIFGDVTAAYDEGGQLATRVLTAPTLEQSTTDLPPLPGLPLDLYSLTGRTYRLAGQIGSTLVTGPRDNLVSRIGYSYTTRRGAGLDNNQSDIFGSVGYNRLLSERATVGVLVGARKSDFDPDGDARVLTPQLTAALRLSQKIRASGAIGLSFSRFTTPLRAERSIGLAANASICGTGEFDLLCATIARDQQTATIAGPANTLSATVNYSKNLGSGETLSFLLSATRFSNGVPIDPNFRLQTNNSLSASAAYTRRLSTRLSGGANLTARKLTQPGPDPAVDVSGSVFLRYRLGELM